MKLLYSKGNIAFLGDSEALQRVVFPNEGLRLGTVLQDYRLTTKDKITLAHAISHAFWLLYSSELMQQKWSSENIWIMQEEDTNSHARAELPLMAYLALDHDKNTAANLPEFVNDGGLILSHRLPRILALGLLLIEIGLGRPLKNRKANDTPGQIRADHTTAMAGLKELKMTEWEGISPGSHLKTTFEESIQSCLRYKTFITPQKPHSSAGSRVPPEAGSGESVDVDIRRDLLYKKVVKPLAHLTKTAFRNNHPDINYLERRAQGENVSPYDDPIQKFEILKLPAAFHSGRPMIAKEWLHNLKSINSQVALMGRHPKVKGQRRIRIAILDTGYNNTIPFFEDERRSERVQAWKDFACSSESPADTYGHGTLMTRLVMESAPLADIYVARVAEAPNKLDDSRANIVEVSILPKQVLYSYIKPRQGNTLGWRTTSRHYLYVFWLYRSRRP